MTKAKTTTKTRTNRTPDQVVADLEERIEEVKLRASRKAIRQTPEGKAFRLALGAMKRASAAAQTAGNEPMMDVLSGAYRELENCWERILSEVPQDGEPTRDL